MNKCSVSMFSISPLLLFKCVTRKKGKRWIFDAWVHFGSSLWLFRKVHFSIVTFRNLLAYQYPMRNLNRVILRKGVLGFCLNQQFCNLANHADFWNWLVEVEQKFCENTISQWVKGLVDTLGKQFLMDNCNFSFLSREHFSRWKVNLSEK